MFVAAFGPKLDDEKEADPPEPFEYKEDWIYKPRFVLFFRVSSSSCLAWKIMLEFFSLFCLLFLFLASILCFSEFFPHLHFVFIAIFVTIFIELEIIKFSRVEYPLLLNSFASSYFLFLIMIARY